MTLNLHGSICALVTPFTQSGELDLPGFKKLLDWHLASGTHGLVIAGSTGESASLDDFEFDQLIETAVSHVAGRIPVIAGCGAAATHKSLRLIKRAKAAGVAAALVVTPYYVRPTQEGLVQHYAALAEGGELPIILYNVPTRTGCDLLPSTVARLVGRDYIIGIKEARAEPERMQALLEFKSAHFSVFSGDDPTFLRAMIAGANGVISVAANVCPAVLSDIAHYAAQGQLAKAQALDAEMTSIYSALGLESNPIPAKWMLSRLGHTNAHLRMPLLELNEQFHAEAERCIQAAQALEQRCFTSKTKAQAA
jgi:4-hydroxy-tetrahydrodipicolinate synthase